MDLSSFVQQLNTGLSKPQQDIRGFSYKVNSVLSGVDNVSKFINSYTQKSVTNKGSVASGVGALHRLEELSKRGDPVLSMDWVGLVMDKGREAINWAYIDEIQTPSITFAQNPVFRGGTEKHYAGPLSVDSLQLKLYTDSNGDAVKFASSWASCIYDNNTGNFGKPSDYKKTIHVYLLDAARKTVCVFKFFGCYPTSWNGYGLDSNANPLDTAMTISVDSVSIDADGSSAASTLSQVTNAVSGFPTIPKLPRIPDFRNLPTLPTIPNINF